MNYLAHAWLSFHQPFVLAGNMISDFVKGKQQYAYPASVQQGIRLHRSIDAFTDSHPVTREAKIYFRSSAGLYSGAFVDIVYDHFLALDEHELSESEWQLFSQEVYSQLTAQQDILPQRFAAMFPYMKEQDWLFNYRYHWGIRNSFGGLVRRAKYLQDAEAPFQAFLEHYDKLGILYREFFPAVKKHALDQLSEHPIL